MKHIIALIALIATTATAQEITLNLAVPLVQTTTVDKIVIVPQRDIVGIARPWIDAAGAWGRKIDADSFRVIIDGEYVAPNPGKLIDDVALALMGDIELTAADMAASMTALGYDSWAGGERELQVTIHAAMRKIASVCNQPASWADAYYAALVAQIMAQVGGEQ